MTLLLLLCAGAFTVPLRSAAQTCTGTLGQITYDTVFSSSYSAPADGISNNYSYNLPQFPLSATSTLYAVATKSTITLTTTVQVQNTGSGTVNPNIKIYRNDDVNGPSGDINNTYAPFPSYGLPSLAPGASETLGPVTPIHNYPIIYDSVNTANGDDLSNYIGSGSNAITYSVNTIPLPSNVQVTNTAVTESLHFTVTYYYCNPAPLATDIITFTATRQDDQTIALNWINDNEQAGREYSVEVSYDGSTFISFASQPSDPVNRDASYQQDYPIGSTDKGKLYFRVKMVNASGLMTYSPIRIVDLGAAVTPGFSIYPNPPSDYLNILFPPAAQGWQVDVLAADGSLVQRDHFNNAGSGRLNFQRKLATGTYFVRATDVQTAKGYVKTFIIR